MQKAAEIFTMIGNLGAILGLVVVLVSFIAFGLAMAQRDDMRMQSGGMGMAMGGAMGVVIKAICAAIAAGLSALG